MLNNPLKSASAPILILALILACLLALTPASLIGWQVLDNVRHHFGEAYARNLTLLKRQSILAPIAHDLALSIRLANSEVTKQWLRDETNPAHKNLFFREAEGYRTDLKSHGYFLASAQSHAFYFNDPQKE